MTALPRHQCLIYKGSPSRQLPAIAAVLQNKLNENYRCLYLDSPSMVAAMQSKLATIGVDVLDELDKTSLVLSSERDQIVEGRFDADRMMQKLEAALQHALDDGFEGLWAVGDMSWEAGFHTAFGTLLDYEWRLEEFFRKHSQIQGICQYHADTLPRANLNVGVLAHPAFFINETLSRLNLRYRRGEIPADLTTMKSHCDEVIDQLCNLDGSNVS